ncbi:bifunctional GNAT family N-acetyltransferase/acetate--CoA ligase family protein [Paeniglutamicibacter sp. Y32M11]|uniref:bifunctional acetate--CoA ligase family protein/GNAT family N-acetyltransferase n=1 Tax=Paeniglutamicibacter sp. Y32M11 TaxID=2853258 RepID=UPI001C529AC1|nr:bifunctional GNAT family N-acetyltransferase/acetate--CoA ligase family protein [Paeniglutamicibacter sp. Y32M11]QXQ11594.1 GNAT family N-acetyltransferase [Paeniglutamicibacter sp. Y32M11]
MVDGRKPGEYPSHWEADVVLRNGSTAHLRPIQPGDADNLQKMHRGQSESSVYMRYFTYKSSLTAKELKRFTEVNHVDRVAFVVTRGDDIIGVGRYDRLDDPTDAEVAFNISDAYQGMGVGSILLEHLAAAARENDIERFSAEVLPENRKMLTVFAEAGYAVKRHFDEGVVMLEFSIDPTEKSRAVMESREHRAEAKSLAGMLAPASIAVIGASREWGAIGHTLLHNIIEGGFTGPVYGVNPQAFELGGNPSYASVSEIPGPIDLAVIAVPQDQILRIISECAAVGAKGLLIVTGGFEKDGEVGLARQRELVRLARANGMRVVGPASLGLVNTDPSIGLNASVAPGMPKRGTLGIFSQSAAIGVLLYAASVRREVGLSSIVSAGNRADVSGNDAMQFWEDDPATSAVGLYLESFGNPRKFSRIARRLSHSKPVIVAKSDVMGLRLPPGHAVRTTQAPTAAVDAMLRQSGVIRVRTNEELMEIAQLVTAQPLPQGNGLAIVSNSAALASVLADAAEQNQLEVVTTETELELAGGQVRAMELLSTTLSAALSSALVHCAIVSLMPTPGLSTGVLATCLREVAAATGKTVVAVFPGIIDPRDQADGVLVAGMDETGKAFGLPCYSSPGVAVNALAAVVRYATWRSREQGEVIEPGGINPAAAADFIEAELSTLRGVELLRLSKAKAAVLLGHYGIKVLQSVRFDTADEAVAAATRLGFPVALKARDEHLRHRLDLGGVRLNITDEASLRSNITHMREVLAPYAAGDLEVQSMAAAGQGCVIRAVEDPLLGPVVSFGLAGDAVNLLDDWAHGVPPLTNTDVADLVAAPRAAARLRGYQGLPGVDLQALEDLLNRVATLKDNHPELSLLEINPVMATASGTTVLSAELWLGNPEQRTDSARRAMRH